MKTLKAALWLLVLALGLGAAIISLPQRADARNTCQVEAYDDDDDGEDQDDDEELSAEDKKKVKITLEQAKAIALKRVPGTILDAELEKEHGRIQYAIDVCDAKGILWDVEIDAVTGDVLQAVEDDDDTTALAPSRRRETWLIT
jgi:uncharacterized membrane protein YkoI